MCICTCAVEQVNKCPLSSCAARADYVHSIVCGCVTACALALSRVHTVASDGCVLASALARARARIICYYYDQRACVRAC